MVNSLNKNSVDNNKKKKTLVLLDVHAIIHRAYHALPDFTSTSGEPTGALYGLASMLIRIIKELDPTYIAACYDLPKPTFRHEVYKEYKAGRKKVDDDLVFQFKKSYDFFRVFNIPVYEAEGFEADDILGTIVEQTKKLKDIEVIIASGDMDTLQLVDGKKVRVFTLRKGITDTILYDEKKVLERYGFTPDLLPDYKGLRGDPSDNIPGVSGIGEKTGTELIKTFGGLENIFSVLKKNREIFIKKGFKERVILLLEKGKEEALFSKILAQIRTDAPILFNTPSDSWREGFDKEKAEEFFRKLNFRSLAGRLEQEFGSPNLKDKTLAKEDTPATDEIKKTAIALWLVDSNIVSPGLPEILSYTSKKNFKDAQKKIFEKLDRDELKHIYKDIEIPVMSILERAEAKGVLIDKKFLKNLSGKYHKELTLLEKRIWKHAGVEFNINSPKQLGEILFEKLSIGVTGVKKTPGGARSTRATELEKLLGSHPIIEDLLSYREVQKLLSTYIDNIPNMLGADGRLHTNFLQTGTTTGRIASQNPNMQNIPIRSERGKKLRHMFIAEKGFKLVTFDYSQMELRCAALLSNDKKLVEILAGGHDVHSETARFVFGVPVQEVSKDMRRAAKVINFGIIFGMGVRALAQNLGSTQEEAKKFYANYFKTFSGLASYLEGVKEYARANGYTKTYFGRRRYFPGIGSNIEYIRKAEERQALNAPIQGTNADITKTAMVRVDNKLRKEGILENAHLLLQIHDELIYEVKEKDIANVSAIIKNEMEGIVTGPVTFPVDVSAGYNWGEMEILTIK